MGVDAPWHNLLGFQHRHMNGIGKSQRIGTPVALDNGPLQTQQAGTVVAARVNAATEGTQHRQGNQTGQTGQWVALEFLAHEMAHQLGDALAALKGDIADKTVADHDIDIIQVDAVTLDETDVVEIAVRQQMGRSLDLLIALKGARQ